MEVDLGEGKLLGADRLDAVGVEQVEQVGWEVVGDDGRRTDDLTAQASPTLRDAYGIGPDCAAEILGWVHWFNHDRLHSRCEDTPPAEFEAAFYAAQRAAPTGVGNQ